VDGKAAALRYNKHKTPMHLLPWDAIGALADHYAKGAKKYGDRNWENGLKWNEGCAASLARHLKAWSMGENYELENLPSGEQIQVWHDEAMAWNAIALIAFRLRGVGLDDRPHRDQEPSEVGVHLAQSMEEPQRSSPELFQTLPYLAP
jgi:hypothetical protein